MKTLLVGQTSPGKRGHFSFVTTVEISQLSSVYVAWTVISSQKIRRVIMRKPIPRPLRCKITAILQRSGLGIGFRMITRRPVAAPVTSDRSGNKWPLLYGYPHPWLSMLQHISSQSTVSLTKQSRWIFIGNKLPLIPSLPSSVTVVKHVLLVV